MTLPSSGPLSLSDIQGEFGGSNPIGMNEYYAGGGLVPSGTTGTYGAVPTSGQISVQNFYGTSNYIPVYIEDLFSTYLYIGNGSTQTITNGINLSGSGGLVWTKMRNSSVRHVLIDSTRGNFELNTNSTSAQSSDSDVAFSSTGYNLSNNTGGVNNNTNTFVSWSFRKQPKFFDIVTYTGTGSARTVAHNLGATPGFIIVKRTDSTGSWYCYHKDLGATQYITLSSIGAADTYSGIWNDTAPTSSVFTVGNYADVNASGGTFIAYLFASNAGGFGATGSDNVITCGTFTTPSSGGVNTVNLGFEPQYILVKRTNTTQSWYIADVMRGWACTDYNGNNSWKMLAPNSTAADSTESGFYPNATGFSYYSGASISGASTYIYVAIRRPMKVPTVGTSVFTPYSTGNDSVATNMNFPIDAFWENNLGGTTYNTSTASRLTGNASMLWTSSNSSANSFFGSLFSNSEQNYYAAGLWGGGTSVIQYGFKRASGFMDVVCYRGTGSATTINHNLGAVPQWIIVKRRSGTESGGGIAVPGDWFVYSQSLGNGYFVLLNGADGASGSGVWNYTTPTSSVFSVGTYFTNYSGDDYVAYLFATVAGVSKVGSYTGTNALQTINCGFTTGARFVLIRQTSGFGGSAYLWDSVRGISSSSDPYIRLNVTGAQVTGTNYVDTTSVGFQVTAAAGIDEVCNQSGQQYTFLAIA